MRFFRKNSIKNIIALFSGLLLFNLCFFQLELSTLKLEKNNRQVYENFIKLFSNVNEEETDGLPEVPSEFSEGKEVDLYLLAEGTLHASTYLIRVHQYNVYRDVHPLSTILETITQPPEC